MAQGRSENMGPGYPNEAVYPHLTTPARNLRPIVHLDTYHTRALVSIIDDLGDILSCEPVPSGADPNSSLVRSHRRVHSSGGGKWFREGLLKLGLPGKKKAAPCPPPGAWRTHYRILPHDICGKQAITEPAR